MSLKGIDISHWNGNIDFNKVKASGIDFVIIKAGGDESRKYTDPKFEDNYKRAVAADLLVGAYYFVGKSFRTIEKGIEDAEHFIKILGGKEFYFPVYLDIEAQEARYKEGITDAAISFCKTLEAKGFYAGIYASDISGFKDRLDITKITDYAAWVARYGKEPQYVKRYGIWQYTSKGSVAGIVGSVDLDIANIDYSKAIKEKGLNNVQKKEVKKTKKKESTKDGI